MPASSSAYAALAVIAWVLAGPARASDLEEMIRARMAKLAEASARMKERDFLALPPKGAAAGDCGDYRRWWRRGRPPPPPGCEQIAPFGDLAWGEGLASAITRLAARDGIEAIQVDTEWHEAASLRTRDGALEAVRMACARRAAFAPPTVSRIPGRRGLLCVGPRQMLVARPVSLAEQAFELRAEFVLDSGALLEDREVPSAGDFFVPFGLTALSLHALERSEAARGRCREIGASLRSRHAHRVGIELLPPLPLALSSASDEVGTELTLRYAPACEISYRSRAALSRLQRSAYRYHLWAEAQRREAAR